MKVTKNSYTLAVDRNTQDEIYISTRYCCDFSENLKPFTFKKLGEIFVENIWIRLI